MYSTEHGNLGALEAVIKLASHAARPWSVLLAGAAVVTAMSAGWLPATGASPPTGTTFSLSFSSQTPSSATGMGLAITYRQPGDPSAKPPAVTSLEIDLPAGAALNLGGVPICSTSDAVIEVLGDSACPAASQVGSGTVTAVTGFGAPVDPIRGNVEIFNDGSGFIEVITLPGLGMPALDDRVTVSGDVLRTQVASIPGGPPDFHTAVKDVAFTFSASDGYITTPPTCPVNGQWDSSARFSFADGTTQEAASSTPCS